MSLLTQAGLASATKTFNGSFNLVFDATIKQGDLLLASGSVDQTNTYVFEVVPRGVGESGSKSFQYWSTGNGDDTMVTLWNPADEAQDFVLTLFFALPDGSRGHYVLPIHLEPRATRTLNASEIIQNQIPDAEGNTIPAVVHEGGMKIAGSQAENQHIMIVAEAGIYNVRKATCYVTCLQCTGYTQAGVLANPFGVAVGGTNQLNMMGTWSSGGQYNLTSSSTWSSNNTPVATVGASSGLVAGVSAGSSTLSAITNLEPIYVAQICGYNPQCPNSNLSGGSPGTVSQFNVAYSAYIPVDHVSGPPTSICFYAGSPYVHIYLGDANRGTYRTTESIIVVPDTQMGSGFFPNAGQTRNYGAGSPANGSTLSAADEDNIANDCHLWNASQTANPSGFLYDVSFPYAHQGQVHFDGSSSNLLEPSAPILWDMRTVIDTTNPLAPTAIVNYNHTCYPSHQIKVNGQVVYLYTPPRNDSVYIFGCLTGLTGKIINQQATPTQVPSY